MAAELLTALQPRNVPCSLCVLREDGPASFLKCRYPIPPWTCVRSREVQIVQGLDRSGRCGRAAVGARAARQGVSGLANRQGALHWAGVQLQHRCDGMPATLEPWQCDCRAFTLL
jgi:hypothetical protein